MNGKIFENIQCFREVDAGLIDKYSDILPKELTEVWAEYGFCALLDGYIKVINPDDYMDIIQNYYKEQGAIPIMMTAFGDVLTWEQNKYIGLVRFKNGDHHIVCSGFKYFWGDLEDPEFLSDFFEKVLYEDAKELRGALEETEIFGYVPLLALGGKDNVHKLRIVKAKEHLELIGQMVGVIM